MGFENRQVCVIPAQGDLIRSKFHVLVPKHTYQEFAFLELYQEPQKYVAAYVTINASKNASPTNT